MFFRALLKFTFNVMTSFLVPTDQIIIKLKEFPVFALIGILAFTLDDHNVIITQFGAIVLVLFFFLSLHAFNSFWCNYNFWLFSPERWCCADSFPITSPIGIHFSVICIKFYYINKIVINTQRAATISGQTCKNEPFQCETVNPSNGDALWANKKITHHQR